MLFVYLINLANLVDVVCFYSAFFGRKLLFNEKLYHQYKLIFTDKNGAQVVVK